MSAATATITHFLQRWAQGERDVVEPLIERAYQDLEQIARKALRTERDDHTLCTAALINESYLRLSARRSINWASRAQFFGFAAQAMRRILIDYARGRRAVKRNGGEPTLCLETLPDPPERRSVERAEILALDQALESLSRAKPRLGQVVEMKFFGGLGLDEIAEVLGTSRSTIKRDWIVAKRWLAHELGVGQPSEGGGNDRGRKKTKGSRSR